MNYNFNIAIVISKFNKDISNGLLNGAELEIKKHENINIEIFEVSGAFEIPGTVNLLIKNNKSFDGILTLGSIIKGETAHFEYISESVTTSISKISSISDIPIIFGVLTTYNYEQASIRSDINKLNKGGEVMKSLLDMIIIYNQIKNK